MSIGGRAMTNPDEVGAASVDYLMYSGYAVLAYLWTRAALVARARLQRGQDAFLEGKLATARFYFDRLLPRAEAHRRAIEAGGASLMAIADPSFDHV